VATIRSSTTSKTGTLDPLERDGRAGSWFPYNSAGDEQGHAFLVEAIDDSPATQAYALHTTGSGYLWAGIGVGLRWGTLDDSGQWVDCYYDASAYAGFRFWARGNGVTVRFSASVPGSIPVEDGGECPADCYNGHGVDLAVGGDWVEYIVSFTSMTQRPGGTLGDFDPTAIRAVSFDFPSESSFDLQLDEIAFYAAGEQARGDAGTMPPSDAGSQDGRTLDAGVEPTGDASPR
jgi:hypothetical protein